MKLDNKKLLFGSLLIVLAAMTRLLPHQPNFSPILGLAAFAGIYLPNKKMAFILPLLAILVSDIFLGFYSTMVFVYGAVAIAILASQLITKTSKSHLKTAGSALLSALIFFVVSNFGHWLMTGMYSYDLNGLIACYGAAIPFFRATLISTMLTVSVLSLIFEIVTRRFAITSNAM